VKLESTTRSKVLKGDVSKNHGEHYAGSGHKVLISYSHREGSRRPDKPRPIVVSGKHIMQRSQQPSVALAARSLTRHNICVFVFPLHKHTSKKIQTSSRSCGEDAGLKIADVHVLAILRPAGRTESKTLVTIKIKVQLGLSSARARRADADEAL
jgi:hypothetical protein